MHAEVELQSLLVLQNEIGLDGKVLRVVGVDDRKLAPLEDCANKISARKDGEWPNRLTRVLSLNTEEEQM